jgi:ABC-type Mn2+/Zn2+ transport system permease subunit
VGLATVPSPLAEYKRVVAQLAGANIIPAATAKRPSKDLTTMLLLAGGLGAGATATALGVILAAWMQREPGPTIVVIAAAMFVATTSRRPT